MSDCFCEPFYIGFADSGEVVSVWKRDLRFLKRYRVLYDLESGIEVAGVRKEIAALLRRLPADE